MKRIQEEEQRRVTELKKALEEKENILTQKVNVTCNLYMDELTNFSSFFYSSFSYSNWKKVRLKTNCAEWLMSWNWKKTKLNNLKMNFERKI